MERLQIPSEDSVEHLLSLIKEREVGKFCDNDSKSEPKSTGPVTEPAILPGYNGRY